MIRKIFFTAMALIFFTSGLAFAGFSSGLVVNGSFENPIPSGSWAGYDSIPGWIRGNQYNIEIQKAGASTSGSKPYDGLQFLELDSNGNSIVKQQINYGAGSYNLSFYYSPRPGTASGDTNAFKVSFGENEFSFTNEVTDSNKTKWSLFTQTVTTTDTNPWLIFQGTGKQDSLGAFIDAVSLTKTPPTPTPIPAAVWIFGSGMVGLLGLRRKRAQS